jgi:hypothetical protein
LPHDLGTVFISYTQDTPQHSQEVLHLSNRLRSDGIDCVLDQYEASPPEGWPQWMDREIRKAQFVLMVCTEAYYRRVMGEEQPGIGHGIAWESSLIYHHIYSARSQNSKFIPLIFDPAHTRYIPTPIQGATRYCLSSPEGYQQLYTRLIGQAPAMKPPLGNRRALPQREVKTTFFYTGRFDQALTSRKSQQQELHPFVFEAQFAELKELQELLGGKDEMGLRETFDIPFMLTKNIAILNEKIAFVRAGKW